MDSKVIFRHSLWDRLTHWLNALLWLALLFSGLALFDNPEINPLGNSYPLWVRSLVGGGGSLLNIHISLGCIWVLLFCLYIWRNWTGTRFFLREVFSLKPGDCTWLMRKPLVMILGEQTTLKYGFNPQLPEQGFYNIGQKAFASVSVLGGLGLVGTGLILASSGLAWDSQIVGWCITIHYALAGLISIGLLVHIYMAAIAPEERPGFISMFTGSVPLEYAKHHHALWVKNF